MNNAIKNILKFIRKKIRKCIYFLNYPLKDYIIFESNPDYQDNTRYIFEEMVRRGINKKYRIFWVVKNENFFKEIRIENVFSLPTKGIVKMLKAQYIIYRAKYIIDCNVYVGMRNKNQIRIYTTHGMPIKFSPQYCSELEHTTFILTTSNYFNSMYEEYYKVNENQIKVTGYPRNDTIFNSHEILYPKIERNKTILWMPTFRNHKFWNVSEATTNIYYPYGVPCINTEEQLKALNDLLVERNMLLIIKLHPVEDTSKLLEMNLSNIKLLDNSYLLNNNKTIYEYLATLDALITDYSSIYYDFLLTQKPIGLAVPDLKEFFEHMVMFPKDFKEEIVGDYIYGYQDLIQFINNISMGIDDSLEQRMEKLKIYHQYIDNHSAKRVVDIIEKEMSKG